MKNRFILLCALLLAACSPMTPQENLNESIDNMLSLIEQGKDVELINKYADLSNVPDPYSRIPDAKMRKIKLMLLKVKKMTPVFSDDNTVATFKGHSLSKTVTFTKPNDTWLLAN